MNLYLIAHLQGSDEDGNKEQSYSLINVFGAQPEYILEDIFAREWIFTQILLLSLNP